MGVQFNSDSRLVTWYSQHDINTLIKYFDPELSAVVVYLPDDSYEIENALFEITGKKITYKEFMSNPTANLAIELENRLGEDLCDIPKLFIFKNEQYDKDTTNAVCRVLENLVEYKIEGC